MLARLREEVAQGYTEYALLLAAIALALLLILLRFGDSLVAIYRSIIDQLPV